MVIIVLAFIMLIYEAWHETKARETMLGIGVSVGILLLLAFIGMGLGL